jgi:hypothetical protein
MTRLVVAHHGISADIDREQGREQANAVNDPLSSMFVALAGIMINPAQICTAQSLPHEVFWVRNAK